MFYHRYPVVIFFLFPLIYSHQSYGEMSLDRDDYEGQTVLILGGGWSVLFYIAFHNHRE